MLPQEAWQRGKETIVFSSVQFQLVGFTTPEVEDVRARLAALGVPLAVLLLRCCEALDAPLDALTLAFVAWNFAMPGVLLVQWPATAERFWQGRRLYAASLATLAAWMLTFVPYATLGAMLGAVASGRFDTLMTAMAAMSRIARRFDPAQGRIRALHDRRYRRFTALQAAAGAGAEGAA